MRKYCGTGQATDANMAHAHYSSNTQGYKHNLRICKTYFFSTATVVAGTPLNVTIHIACLVVKYQDHTIPTIC